MLHGSLQPRRMDESLQTNIQISNPWMRDWQWCHTLGFISRRPFLKNERSLNDLNVIPLISMICNPKGIKREVFIGKNLKSFGFGRVLNHICVKNLDIICMIARANLLTIWAPRALKRYGLLKRFGVLERSKSLEWSYSISKVNFKIF